MNYYRYFPEHPQLKEVVQYLYWIEHRDIAAHQHQFVMPEGCFELIFNLDQPVHFYGKNIEWKMPSISFYGMSQQKVQLSAQNIHAIVVKFKASGIASFTQESVGQFSAQPVDAMDIFPHDTLLSLYEYLLEEHTIEDKMTQLTIFLVNHLKFQSDPRVLHCLRQFHRLHESYSILQLSKEVNTSERYLRSLFHRHVGLAPKVYSRMHRFYRAFQLLKSNNASHILTKIAHELDYTDQSHFIKECRAITTKSPKKFRDELSTSVFYNF